MMADRIAHEHESLSTEAAATESLIRCPGKVVADERPPEALPQLDRERRGIGLVERGCAILVGPKRQRHVQADSDLPRRNAIGEDGTGPAQAEVPVALERKLHVLDEQSGHPRVGPRAGVDAERAMRDAGPPRGACD